MSGLWKGQVEERPNPIIDSFARPEPVEIGPKGMPATEVHTADEPILLKMQPAKESLSESRLAEKASAETVPMVEPERSRQRRSLYDRDPFTANPNKVKREQQKAKLQGKQNKKEQHRRGQEPSRRSERYASDRAKHGEKEDERHGYFSDHSSGRSRHRRGAPQTIENHMAKGEEYSYYTLNNESKATMPVPDMSSRSSTTSFSRPHFSHSRSGGRCRRNSIPDESYNYNTDVGDTRRRRHRHKHEVKVLRESRLRNLGYMIRSAFSLLKKIFKVHY